MTVPIALMCTILVFCLEKQNESESHNSTEDMIYRLKAIDVNRLTDEDWSTIFKRAIALMNQV